MGVTEEDLISSAPLAAADHCSSTNPRVFTEKDALELYRTCL
jgi:alcohol dehydrogenase class IV